MSESRRQRIEQIVRPEIRALQAYHAAAPGDYLKLDAMESPFPWPESLQAELHQAVATAEINRYPDAGAVQLKQQLRDVFAVADDCDLLLGNGSDEIIQLLALTCRGNDDGDVSPTILAPEPSFVMYGMTATFVGMDYVGVPLQADFSLDLPAMLAAIETHKPALTFLSYPNNPTGNLFARADIEAIIAASPGLVVVDEAYYAYANDSFMGDVSRYDNLVVMRTISKLGFAGLRLGFMVGQSAWIEEINKARMPYNINVLTQAVAQVALANWPQFILLTEELVSEREYLIDELEKLGATVYPSAANFVTCSFGENSAEQLHQRLKNAGVLIKCLHNANTLVADCLRITVSMRTENEQMLSVLAEILAD